MVAAAPAPSPMRGVSIEDLAWVPVLRLEDHAATPAPWADHAPDPTPDTVASTFQAALTLVGSGLGVFPVGAHARHYYARPYVAYVPFNDAPPLEWDLMWPTGRVTARAALVPKPQRTA